jgi:hypothetical protein
MHSSHSTVHTGNNPETFGRSSEGQKKLSTSEKAAETPGSDHLTDYRRKTCRMAKMPATHPETFG